MLLKLALVTQSLSLLLTTYLAIAGSQPYWVPLLNFVTLILLVFCAIRR